MTASSIQAEVAVSFIDTTTRWAKMRAWLDAYFHLTARGTTVVTEFRAGTSSFLTLSYLLLVNPQIMAQAGVDQQAAVLATAVSAAVASLTVGLGGNLPFGCAPGLGLSAYLTFGLVQAELLTLPQALSLCWWAGILVFVVAVTGVARLLMEIVPQAIKYGIVVGMGMLIAMIGMVSAGLIVANPSTLVELGPVLDDPSLQLCLAGILLVASLLYHDVTGAILIGLSVLTILGWMMDGSWPTSLIHFPPLGDLNIYWEPGVILDVGKAGVIIPALLSFLLICIFDISGVMFGLATLGNILTPTGDIPGSVWAFVASAAGTVVAAWLGSTPIIVCVECASGVREGGRTGLTAVVVGLYFLCSVFLAPLFEAVPVVATAPVLVMVGVLMMGESAKIAWHNMNEALPAFLTIVLMPLTYSITNGMIFGLLASVGFYFTSGQCFQDVQTAHTACVSTCGAVSTKDDEEELFEDATTGYHHDSKPFEGKPLIAENGLAHTDGTASDYGSAV